MAPAINRKKGVSILCDRETAWFVPRISTSPRTATMPAAETLRAAAGCVAARRCSGLSARRWVRLRPRALIRSHPTGGAA
ncbi:MAG: hypothetical protein WCP22_02840, partial [Chlamydiota bacterium]